MYIWEISSQLDSFMRFLNEIAHKAPDMLVITGDIFDSGKNK